MPLTLFVRVQKVIQGLRVRGSWRPNINWKILTPKLVAVNVVSFSFFWCSTGALRSTLLGAGFLYCILSASSLDPNSSGRPEGPFGRVWLSLPHLVSNSVRSSTLWNSNSTANCPQLNWQLHSNSNSTELYNGSTPTRSLKSHVWSSSSGNNCHAVHRSLSSGASVYF